MAALLVVLASASCARRESARDEATPDTGPPRDLLLLTLDTFRADRAGCFGYPGGLTPAIDRALRPALLARDAYAPAPLTAVSHATILTGLQPYHHGVRENGLFTLPDSVTTLAAHLSRHGFRTAAFIAAFPLEKRFGFAQGFASFDEDLGPDPGLGTYYAERPAREVVDRVLAWTRGLARDDRAFLWAHFFDAHQPHRASAALRRLPAPGDYEREIREMDGQIGRLLRGLEEAGRRPLLAIVSDHGEGLGQHRELTHGILLHEETMHGLIGIAGPRGSAVAGRLHGVRQTVATYADIAPTLLDALGLPPMADRDGTSLLAPASPEGAYGETYYPMLQYRWSPLLSWRDDRWAYLEGPHRELYDRAADPGELRNVAAEHPDVVDSLSRRIADVASAPPEPSGDTLDPGAREKLLALGYIASRRAGYDPKKDPSDYIDAVNSLFHGMTLVSEGKASEALPALRSAYAADPENAVTVFYLASCLRELGDVGTAMTYYQRAIQLDPRVAEAWAHLAVLRFDRGEKEAAFRLLDDGLRVNPEAFALLMTAGELSRDEGRLEEAKGRFEHAASVEPKRFEPWSALADLAERRGDVAEARKLRERAQKLSPADSARAGAAR
ncbi:MAG: sulfatase-like hydrolase/transferase [bacterium]